VVALMTDLECFINTDGAFDADPLIKMAIAHHQIESNHPFCDGNGRTGRIVNVLVLLNKGLSDISVQYLSSAIVRSKPDYYRLLQAVREEADAPERWQEWVLYLLAAAEFVQKVKVGGSNYCINVSLNTILTRTSDDGRSAL
jgi:Fic family protein